MKIKAFSLILLFILLLFGVFFLIEHFQTCYKCNPALTSKAAPDDFEAPDMIMAIVNFIFAVFSAYLMVRKRYRTSAIISGIVAGLQVTIVATIIVLSI
jgi:hypothetical protein